MAAPERKLTILDIAAKHDQGDPLTMVTVFDYPTGRLADQSGLDMVLVGDSLGMTVLGYDGTVPVTMDQMIHHAKAVMRGVGRALVVGDLPFGAYQASAQQAIENAVRMLKEGGTDVVKMEGGEDLAPKVAAVVEAGIPVMGHIGLTPQLTAKLGGFKVQGKDAATSVQLVRDAQALEAAGCFSIVLEAIPDRVAKLITETISIPTIGIGAGPHCSGQILVLADMIGLFDKFTPKFAKRYCDVSAEVSRALGEFVGEVKSGQFPLKEHSFTIKDDELDAVQSALKAQ